MEFRGEIETAAAAKGLELPLLAALVEQESNYDASAWNPEPRYRYLWNVRTGQPFRRVSDHELDQPKQQLRIADATPALVADQRHMRLAAPARLGQLALSFEQLPESPMEVESVRPAAHRFAKPCFGRFDRAG